MINMFISFLILTSMFTSEPSLANEGIFDVRKKCIANDVNNITYNKAKIVAKCVAKHCVKNTIQCSSLSKEILSHWYNLNIDKIKNNTKLTVEKKLHQLSEWIRIENIELSKNGNITHDFQRVADYFIANYDSWDGYIVKSIIANGYYNEELFYDYYTTKEPGVFLVKKSLADNQSLLLLNEFKKHRKLDELMMRYSSKHVLDIILENLDSELMNTTYLKFIKRSLSENQQNTSIFKRALLKLVKKRTLSPINSIIEDVFPLMKDDNNWPFIAMISNREISGQVLKSLTIEDDYTLFLDYCKLVTKYNETRLDKLFNKIPLNNALYEKLIINFPKIMLSHGQVVANENTAEFFYLNHLYSNKNKIKKDLLKSAIEDITITNTSSSYYLLALSKDIYTRQDYVEFISKILIETKKTSILTEFIPNASLNELNDLFELTKEYKLDIWQVILDLSISEGEIKKFIVEKIKSNDLGDYRLTLLLKLNSFQLKLLAQNGNIDILKEFSVNFLKDQASYNLQRSDMELFIEVIKKRSDIEFPRRLALKLEDSLKIENTNLSEVLDNITNSIGDNTFERVAQMDSSLNSIAKIIRISHYGIEVKKLKSSLIRLEEIIRDKQTQSLESWTDQFYRLIELHKNAIKNGLIKDPNENTLLGKLSLIFSQSSSNKSKVYIEKVLEYIQLAETIRMPLTRNLNTSLFLATEFKYSLATTDKDYLNSLNRNKLDLLKKAVDLYLNLPTRIMKQSGKDQDVKNIDILKIYFSSYSLYFNTFNDTTITGVVECDQSSECLFNFEKRNSISSAMAIKSIHQNYNQEISYGEYLASNELGKNISSSFIKIPRARNLEIKGTLNDVLLIDASFSRDQTPGKPLNGRNASPPEHGYRTVRVEYCKTRIKFGLGSMCVNHGVKDEQQRYTKVPAKIAHPGRDGIVGSDSALVSINILNPKSSSPFGSIIVLNSPGDAGKAAKGGRPCGTCGGIYAQAGKNGVKKNAGKVGNIILKSMAKQFPILQLNKRTPDPVMVAKEKDINLNTNE